MHKEFYGKLFKEDWGNEKMAAKAGSTIAIIKKYIQELEKHHFPISEAIIFGSHALYRPEKL